MGLPLTSAQQNHSGTYNKNIVTLRKTVMVLLQNLEEHSIFLRGLFDRRATTAVEGKQFCSMEC